jgi:NADPH2:quinone reductase
VDLDVTRGSLYITRPTLRHHIQGGDLRTRADALFGWLTAGKMTVRISHTFPLAEAAEAQRVLEERRSLGKVLLEF